MPTDDRLELRGLRVMARCGVLPEELERPQPFDIDIDVTFDAAPAAGSDNLGDTVDYGAVVDRVVALADSHHHLMERFAGVIADAVLEDPLAASVEITVTKLRPPVPRDLATAGVRLRRTR